MIEQNFNRFGREFKVRFLKSCISDPEFFNTIYPICKSEYLDDGSFSVFYTKMVQFFEKYKSIPSLNELEIEFGNVNNEELKESCLFIVAEIKKNGYTGTELKQVKDLSFEFCSEKEMEQAIYDSVDLLKKGKRDAIKYRVEKALRHVHIIDNGHIFFQEKFVDERMKSTMRNTVTTGLPLLDSKNVLDGGFGGGELYIYIAPTGGGKSYLLCRNGLGALVAKKNVIHYTFELSETNIGRRYDAGITKIPINKLRDEQDLVRKRLEEFDGGKLIIKEFPTRSININKIKFHIDRVMATGFEPDEIIIDYADLMNSTKNFEQRTWELESIYEELRGFAMEIKKPIISASQSNRSGTNSDIIGLDQIADAYAKAQIADFVATFSRNQIEKENNLGKLYIAKNRMGYDGMVFGVNFDPSITHLELFEMNPEDVVKKDIEDNISDLFREFKDKKVN